MAEAKIKNVSSKKEAVIIATRNRPSDLKRTLESITHADSSDDLLIMIIDGSNSAQARANQHVLDKFSLITTVYHSFPGRPAGTRQRNYGVDHLPDSVQLVHFIDDDVKVSPDYFRQITSTFQDHPRVGGVGGFIVEQNPISQSQSISLRRLFFLDAKEPGSVLPSGHVSYFPESDQIHPVQWLSTCSSSYRRAIFDEYRFDPAVEGPSPRLEDLDFSHRVRQSWTLLFQPKARLIHYVSPVNRLKRKRFVAERLIRRYWFVEKNIRHPLRKPAFWWATLGQTLAMLTSSYPDKWKALRGHLRGIRDVLTRNHPLLES